MSPEEFRKDVARSLSIIAFAFAVIASTQIATCGSAAHADPYQEGETWTCPLTRPDTPEGRAELSALCDSIHREQHPQHQAARPLTWCEKRIDSGPEPLDGLGRKALAACTLARIPGIDFLFWKAVADWDPSAPVVVELPKAKP